MTDFDIHSLNIADSGHTVYLTYEGLLSFHQGEAVWGASVGFRAMQAAELALSTDGQWDRKDLSVVSAHPGPGVRDAMEYVTQCVSRDRFHLQDPTRESGCHAKMEFRWWVSGLSQTIEIELRSGFVPQMFFELLDRIGTDREHPDDETQLQDLKTELTAQIWSESLDDLFRVAPGVAPISKEMNPCTN